MFTHSGRLALAHRAYPEIYFENGRWYGTYKKGKYLFPIDEVRPLSFIRSSPLRRR